MSDPTDSVDRDEPEAYLRGADPTMNIIDRSWGCMLKRLALVGTALIKRLDAMEKERIKRGPVPNKK